MRGCWGDWCGWVGRGIARHYARAVAFCQFLQLGLVVKLVHHPLQGKGSGAGAVSARGLDKRLGARDGTDTHQPEFCAQVALVCATSAQSVRDALPQRNAPEGRWRATS